MNTQKQDRSSRLPEIVMLCISLIVVCAIALLSYRNIQAIEQALEQHEISQDLMNLSSELLSVIKDAEMDQRDFLLTGKERYLEPFDHAILAIPPLLERLRIQTARMPDQVENIRNLEPLVFAKLAGLRETVELRQSNRQMEVRAILESGRGKRLMDEIRVLCNAIEQTAIKHLAASAEAEEESSDHLRVISLLGSGLLLVFLLISAAVIFRGMGRREALYKEAEASRKLLATTLEGIADAVIATDTNGRVTFINPVAQELTGWKEPEALGRPISEVFSIVNETTQLKVDKPLEKALAEDVAVGLANHTNLIARNGLQCSIDDSAAPLRDKQGNLIGGVLVFRDISARRHSERQLEEALSALGRSNEELQQFVNAAAHDLRSPLNSVGGMAQLLSLKLGDQLDDKCKELLGYINSGVSRMAQLLEDLLSFAQASHFDNSAGQVSLDQALQAALANLSFEVAKSGAAATSDPLPVVEAHEARMLQLFQNLISNALKYRSSHPPRIHVSAEQGNGEWIIGVSDNGIGIDPAYAEQIFKPFERLHGAAYPGNGIGLASCQKIVAGYGGRIWVEAMPDGGSKFFFTLPVAASARDEMPR